MRYITDRRPPGSTSQFIREKFLKKICESGRLPSFESLTSRVISNILRTESRMAKSKDLMENPIGKFLLISRSAIFRRQEKRNVSPLFPTYCSTIELALNSIKETN
ncbi:hypothetical protein TSAR_002902 [Trichomalopsis sarcophagae]|uniref:Uncharacterized protein n=1 Tax=Trichomalopsis sarcophagae TaxID=543379 RepID=A0A232EKG0_9HYME|nr:hypothetical protein TSAR_002902 [Trichomalopsis sarcophagae]